MSAAGSVAALWRSRPFHERVLGGGLAVYALLFYATGAMFAAGGQPAPLGFAAVFGTVSLLLAGAALAVGGWALTAAFIWALLSSFFQSAALLPLMINVASFPDLGMGLALLASILVATAGGVLSFLQRHEEETVRQEATPRELRLLRRTAAIVVVVMVFSGALHLMSIDTVGAPERAGAIVIDIDNNEFVPNEITVAAGQPLKLLVRNGDFGVHTFTVLGVTPSTGIVGGSEKLVTIGPLAPGEYEFACEIPGHEDQRGTLVVRGADG